MRAKEFHAVYIYWRSPLHLGKSLLYIGKDKNFPNRCAAHKKNQEPWHLHATRITVFRFRSHAMAGWGEELAIWVLAPEFNLLHQRKRRRAHAVRARRLGRPVPTWGTFFWWCVHACFWSWLAWSHAPQLFR